MPDARGARRAPGVAAGGGRHPRRPLDRRRAPSPLFPPCRSPAQIPGPLTYRCNQQQGCCREHAHRSSRWCGWRARWGLLGGEEGSGRWEEWGSDDGGSVTAPEGRGSQLPSPSMPRRSVPDGTVHTLLPFQAETVSCPAAPTLHHQAGLSALVLQVGTASCGPPPWGCAAARRRCARPAAGAVRCIIITVAAGMQLNHDAHRSLPCEHLCAASPACAGGPLRADTLTPPPLLPRAPPPPPLPRPRRCRHRRLRRAAAPHPPPASGGPRPPRRAPWRWRCRQRGCRARPRPSAPACLRMGGGTQGAPVGVGASQARKRAGMATQLLCPAARRWTGKQPRWWSSTGSGPSNGGSPSSASARSALETSGLLPNVRRTSLSSTSARHQGRYSSGGALIRGLPAAALELEGLDVPAGWCRLLRQPQAAEARTACATGGQRARLPAGAAKHDQRKHGRQLTLAVADVHQHLEGEALHARQLARQALPHLQRGRHLRGGQGGPRRAAGVSKQSGVACGLGDEPWQLHNASARSADACTPAAATAQPSTAPWPPSPAPTPHQPSLGLCRRGWSGCAPASPAWAARCRPRRLQHQQPRPLPPLPPPRRPQTRCPHPRLRPAGLGAAGR